MNAARAYVRPDGKGLHLHHGPIDLLISAEGSGGAVDAAFRAAARRFESVLEELVRELPLLRAPGREMGAATEGPVARRMFASVRPHSLRSFVTPMAAVAGSVAEEILERMLRAADLKRAFVNNGGDIAFHLQEGCSCRAAIADLRGGYLGDFKISAAMPVRGIATSGRGGRSLSLGIADSVTVLALTASAADAAATLIANAADLPGHPAVRRRPARSIDDDSDLGMRLAVTGCGRLTDCEIRAALAAGAEAAEDMRGRGLVEAAALTLQGQTRLVGSAPFTPVERERRMTDA